MQEITIHVQTYHLATISNILGELIQWYIFRSVLSFTANTELRHMSNTVQFIQLLFVFLSKLLLLIMYLGKHVDVTSDL